MSVAHTAPLAAGRTALPRWLAGGTLTAAILAAAAIAVWPASATDTARTDGEHFGQAVAQLQSATTTAEVNDALNEISIAASDTRSHAGDAVAGQVDDQAYALDRAAEGYVGSRTSDDAFSADVYQSELDAALDDLSSQAEDFRTTGPEVQQAFWDGYQTGVQG